MIKKFYRSDSLDIIDLYQCGDDCWVKRQKWYWLTMTSLPLQLWPNTLCEMYLCSSSLFPLKSAQHGHNGIRKGSCVCGLLSRCKSYRPTGGQRPAEKGVRKRSTLRTKAVTQRTRWQYSVGGVYIGTKFSYFYSIE